MDKLLQQISEIGVVPVIKLGHPTRDAAPLAKALCEGGVPVAEVTFRAAGAADAIRIMKETCPDMIVGAGTVLTTAQVDEALAAGAQFIVTPGFARKSRSSSCPAAPPRPTTTLHTSSVWKF